MTRSGGEHLRAVVSPQVLICSLVRDKLSREIGATEYYKHSSTVDAWEDVRTVADLLLKDGVFTFMPGRTSPQVPDLYTKGKSEVWNGRVIDRYVQKRLESLGEDSDTLGLAALDEDIEAALGQSDLNSLVREDSDTDELRELMDGLL
jgi:hypothetical protein